MDELEKYVNEWRHHFHANPETAFEEHQTARDISEELKRLGFTVHEGVGGTGVVAELKRGTGTRIIGLRADMDALPIQETGTMSYRSRHAGKMHGCGHDGHMATLLGTAMLLSERHDINGMIRLIFQPAEEPGKGSQAMIDGGLLSEYPMDEIFGFHNMPSLPEGTFHTKVGGIMSSEDNFVIKIKGKGGHSSSPHLGIDPLMTASQIIQALQTVVSRSADPVDPAVISCTEILTDGAHNTIPGIVTILGDTRSNTRDMQEMIHQRMEKICQGICEMNGAMLEFTYSHEFKPTINSKESTVAAVALAKSIFGEDRVNGDCMPWMASEDFGNFLEWIPGCLIFIGTGTNPIPLNNIPLHNPQFNYNDSVLVQSAEFFAELAVQRLKQ